MKFKFSTYTTTVALLAALAIPLQLVAQHTRYKLIDLGTLAGPNNFGAVSQGVGLQVLNNRGIVTGSAETSIPDPYTPNCSNPDCLVSHAFRWYKGIITDLGALPGINNSFGNWISANGLISGASQNSGIDPLLGSPELRAVSWNQVGQIADLGTFGGYESFANAVNTRGQVVGFATNAIPDPFNTAPNLYGLGTQMHAFLWENGEMRDLGTLGGPDSTAFWVNEAGQVAGFSYTSSIPNPITGVPPQHPFLWENGKMLDLGTIGGTQLTDLPGLNERGQVIGEMTLADEQRTHPFFWDGKKLIDLGTFGGDHANANSLNNKGEVVGQSSYAASCPNPEAGQITHAYLWRNGIKTDLGTFPGIDPLNESSTAWWINSKTQIVGIAATCDFSVFGAFLWEKGSMVDLNTLIPADSPLRLFLGTYIDDRGEITGFGVLPNGDQHAFLLIPCGEETTACGGDAASAVTTRAHRSPLTMAQRLAMQRTMAGHRGRLGHSYPIAAPWTRKD